MGPKRNERNKKLLMKKTSTPLNVNVVENALPAFENISTVKVLRARNVIFNTGSSLHKRRRKESTVSKTILSTDVVSEKTCKPIRGSPVVSKQKYKLRPDTPLNLRKSSQQSSSLALIQRKLFSRASSSPNQRFRACSRGNCLLDDSSVMPKKNCKLRPDTLLNPRRSSQQSSSLALIREKSKFSRASNSPNQRFLDSSEGKSFLDNKFSAGIDESGSRRQSKMSASGTANSASSVNQDEFFLCDSTVLIDIPMCMDEKNKDKTAVSDDIILSTSLNSKKPEEKDLAVQEIRETFIQKQEFEVNALDEWDSTEICRRDTSGIEVASAITSLHLDLLSDEPTHNILDESCCNMLTLEEKDASFSNHVNDIKENEVRESKNNVCNSKSPNFKVKPPFRESSRLTTFKKRNNSNGPESDYYHIKQNALEEVIANILIKKTHKLNSEEKLKDIKAAQENSTVVSNGKDMYEQISGLSFTCNCKKSSCTKCTKETELQNISPFNMITESRLNITCTENAEDMHEKDQRSTLVNTRKRKTKLSRVRKKEEAKSKNVTSNTRMKRNKVAASSDIFPSTSTPVDTNNKVASKDFDLYFENLRMTEIKAPKFYGRLLKTRKKSEASRRWESFMKKGRKNATKNSNNTTENSKCSLDKTPPLKMLENVPIDEGLRLRRKSEIDKKRKIRENGRKNIRNKAMNFNSTTEKSDCSLFKTPPMMLENVPIDVLSLRITPEIEKERKNRKNGGNISKKSSQKALYDSKKFKEIASHFDDISKHSLLTEVV